MTEETTNRTKCPGRDERSTHAVPQNRNSRTSPAVSPKARSASSVRASTGHALPGWAIDLITEGMPLEDLRREGNRAVMRGLIRTAMSAQHRDWSVMEWEALITGPSRALVTQLRRGPRRQDPSQTRKALHWAWNAAWENRTTTPPWTPTKTADEVRARAQTAVTAANDPHSGFLAGDRAVLLYAADQAISRGLTRVALPWRTVAKETGLGERSTKNALKRLVAAGYLSLVQKGTSGDPKAAKLRANIYELAPYKSRGTRPMGPPGGDPVPNQLPCETPSRAAAPAIDAAPRRKAAPGLPGVRLTRHPDGFLVLETTATTEAALLSLLSTFIADHTTLWP